MTRNPSGGADRLGGGLDDPPGLHATDGRTILPIVRENMRTLPECKAQPERVDRLLVQGDRLLLAGFSLDHGEVTAELLPLKIIHIFPSEPEEVTDPKRGANA